jgi:uncharacterized protein (DUF433 family)
MLVETRYEHIVLDEKNVPVIAGTRTKVVDVVLDKIAYGWSPEEMHYQPPHLTLGQIHSALAYYWDHQVEIDQYIERQLKYVDEMQRKASPTPLKIRLKAQGLI